MVNKNNLNQINPKELALTQLKKKREIALKIKKLLENGKRETNTFTKDLISKFKKNLAAVAILPPKNPAKPLTDILVMLKTEGDLQAKYKKKKELEEKIRDLGKKKIKKGLRVFKGISPDGKENFDNPDGVGLNIILVEELWDMLEKGKYDILQIITLGLPVYGEEWLKTLRALEIHKMQTLKKFEKYVIAYVFAGSMVRGESEPTSDVDTYIVIDDTDVTRMAATELISKLRHIIYGMVPESCEVAGVRPGKIHPQIYVLTDMWNSIKSANPVIFTLLREGIPLYDRGMFTPWKILLKRGKVTPTPESIDSYMKMGRQMLDRVKFKFREIGEADLWWATVTPAQGALMLVGVPPPVPRAVADEVRQYFVNKGLLEEKYAKTIEETVKLFKDIEHGRVKEVDPKLISRLLVDVNAYLERMDKLFEKLEATQAKDEIKDLYNKAIENAIALLRMVDVNAEEKNAITYVETKLVKESLAPQRYLETLRRIAELNKRGKANRREIASLIFDEDMLFKDIIDMIRSKKGIKVEKYKISANYEDKRADIWLLSKIAFVIKDTSKTNTEILKLEIAEDGSLIKPKKSSLAEINKTVKTFNGAPTIVTNKTIDSLKDVIHKDIKIVIGA